MTSGIEQAAAAFDVDMGAPKTVNSSSSPAVLQMDEIFPTRVKETDVVAGGDDTPMEGESQQQTSAQRQVEGEPTEEDILYGDDAKDPESEDEEVEAADPDEVDPEVETVDIDAEGDRLVTVTIDGEEKVIPLREATQGYIRTQTFHQRLNHIDEVENTLRSEAATLLEEKKQVVTTLDALIGDQETLLPAEPDWDAEFAKDAAKARQKQKVFTEFNTKLSALRQRRHQAALEVQAQVEKDTVQFATKERKKFEDANPIWGSDPEKKKKDLASMVRTARAARLTDKEIAGIIDSRYLGILLKASKFDRMMAARPKSVPRGKSPVKPGAGRTRTVPKGVDRSQRQLQRTGSVADAAAVMDQIIAKG